MDRKDELILQQLETIRTMAEHSLNRMGTDFWGNPKAAPAVPAEENPKKPEAKLSAEPPQPKDEAEERKTPEKIEDLKAELDSYIGWKL